VKDAVNAADSALRLYYDGHFGDTTEIHSVGLKGSATFLSVGPGGEPVIPASRPRRSRVTDVRYSLKNETFGDRTAGVIG
jgi:hypothetical protein